MRLSTVTVVIGLAASVGAQGPSFEVASIRQGQPNSDSNPTTNDPQPGGRWLARNARIVSLLVEATGYDQPGQIVGGPAWMRDEPWDIDARAADASTPPVLLRKMLLALMTERFALRYRVEQRPFEVLALVRLSGDGRPRPGLRAPTVECGEWAAAVARGDKAERPPNPSPDRPSCGIRLTRVTPDASALRLTGAGADSQRLVSMLAYYARRAASLHEAPVVDRTGLERFDIDLMFSPNVGPSVFANDAPDAPLLVDALRNQLGLAFEKRTEMLDVMVIERIERPTPN